MLSQSSQTSEMVVFQNGVAGWVGLGGNQKTDSRFASSKQKVRSVQGVCVEGVWAAKNILLVGNVEIYFLLGNRVTGD